MFNTLISLLRPYQWVKNVFVLMPLFFGGQLLNSECWVQGSLTFVAFSLMASGIYCFNDLHDIETDRRHPKKRKRPLASGKLKPIYAVILMVGLVISSLTISYFMLGALADKGGVLLLLVFYLCQNIAYSYKLKQYAIIDVFVISFGFVLRLVAGSMACAIWLSPWIVLMTFLLALFLAFAKRRDDVLLYENEHIMARKNVIKYNIPFMNQTLGLIGAITIVCYIMYSISPEVVARFNNGYVYVTSIFVLAAILRYLQVTMVNQQSGSPTNVLLRDRFIQMCLLLWIATFAVILYL